jgi:prolipoprotein diacylglyceryltransferase
MEFTLLFAAAVGPGAAWIVLRFGEPHDEAEASRRELWDTMLTGIIAGVLVGRLAAMLTAGVNPITHLGDVVVIRGGVATGWAGLAGLVTIGVAAWRRRRPKLPDALAPAALTGLAGWHAGCVLRSACLGTPTSLPVGWAQPGSEIVRHPVELYAAALLLLAAALVWIWRRRAPLFAPAGAALAAAGMARLVTEPLRPSLHGGPVAWYAGALAAGTLVAAVALARRSAKHDREPPPPRR